MVKNDSKNIKVPQKAFDTSKSKKLGSTTKNSFVKPSLKSSKKEFKNRNSNYSSVISGRYVHI